MMPMMVDIRGGVPFSIVAPSARSTQNLTTTFSNMIEAAAPF